MLLGARGWGSCAYGKTWLAWVFCSFIAWVSWFSGQESVSATKNKSHQQLNLTRVETTWNDGRNRGLLTAHTNCCHMQTFFFLSHHWHCRLPTTSNGGIEKSTIFSWTKEIGFCDLPVQQGKQRTEKMLLSLRCTLRFGVCSQLQHGLL